MADAFVAVADDATAVSDFDRSATFFPTHNWTPADDTRVIIASTSGGGSARFAAGGCSSFSNQFWTAIKNGRNVRSAFLTAKSALRDTGSGQFAQLDDNGNGLPNEPVDGNVARGIIIDARTIPSLDPRRSCLMIIIEDASHVFEAPS